jgi:hypothetical protein
MKKAVALSVVLVTGIGLLSACSSSSIHQVTPQPNGLLSGDSCLVIEGRLDGLSVLFSNGLVFFGSQQSIEDQKHFTDNNLYECRYCWGRYQYQTPALTVFQPLPDGYLNLPGSYPVKKLEYRLHNGRISSVSDPTEKMIIQKARLFIKPDRAWLARKPIR